eukprot:CAMPEP_0118643692 /NCGR_PEP_ID=MMETSP0785-20121206/6528_1 /TAXON_ID=91992 /ORGANISM="Bolidomonas pacifica, Strain CCMP 1866" /LENGTH=1314 /DNA_ID=CAMNT_0006535375 /DNA_START=251 /DNA_END=4195 /DNA_ORIENTATION=-
MSSLLFFLLLSSFPANVLSANWAQLAGIRAQNVAKPYIPQDNHLYQRADEAEYPMWSARWGHASAVYNSSVPRNDLTIDENSKRLLTLSSRLLVMGGDDRILDNYIIKEENAKVGVPDGWQEGDHKGYGATQADGVRGGKTAHGSFLNDVWYSNPKPGSEDGWNVVPDSSLGSVDRSEVIQSQMAWRQSNPGRINPATWPVTDPRYCGDKCTLTNHAERAHVAGAPLSYRDWIMCQPVFRDTLEDPSVCELNPVCLEPNVAADIQEFYTSERGVWPMDDEGPEVGGMPVNPLCKPQALWVFDNMWSPRRGHKAVVAGEDKKPDLLYVMGGRARETMRIADDRMVGGIIGPRVKTEPDRITTREETVLKNDVWVSPDGLGASWELVNPGCEVPQEDVLAQFEVWSGYNTADKHVGQLSQKCETNDDCYGSAICKQIEPPHSVCVCPMWSPRENHAVAVQHVFKVTPEDGNGTPRSLDISEDYIYVVGGFINRRNSFCGSFACGTNVYRHYMDDAWVSNNGGKDWVQFKDAFDTRASYFQGRGAHAVALISHPLIPKDPLGEKFDQLWVFGGETEINEKTEYLNDVWRIELPREPCCIKNGDCNIDHPLTIDDVSNVQGDGKCLPGRAEDWKNVTSVPPLDGGEWSGADWPKRSGHNVIVEPPDGNNNDVQRMVLVGGNDAETVFDDVWTWGFENPKNEKGELYMDVFPDSVCEEGEYTCRWEQDYKPGQWYKTNSGSSGIRDEDAVEEFYYGPGNGSPGDVNPYMPTTPQQYYFYAGTEIEALGVRVKLPEPPTDKNFDEAKYALRYPELSDDDIAQIQSKGIYTLQDLLDAETKDILNLRGFDFPQVEERLTVGDKICDVLYLAKAIQKKCTVRQVQRYDMEHQLPQNVNPVFDNPSLVTPDAHFQWVGGGRESNSHGKVYGKAADDGGDDDGFDIFSWDGCEAIMEEGGDDDAAAPAALEEVDFPGYGLVTIPTSIRDPTNRETNDMEEIKCRQNPGARTMAAAEFFGQEVLLMGGKRDHKTFFRDVWSRDDHLPTATLKSKPLSEVRLSEVLFEFDTDTAGASLFEYKVVDSEEKRDVIPWTLTTRTLGADVLELLDLNWPMMTGPGSGEYLFYLRAIDPAGNVGFQYKVDNVYKWTFLSPHPWGWIIGGICLGVMMLFGLYMEYRRRKKKKAMERYAIKRMRRKFKGQAKGGDDKKADWRQLAAEDGDDKKKKKKRKKKDKKKKKKKGLKERTKDKDKSKKKDKKKKKKKKKDKDGKSKDKDKKRKDKEKKKKSGKEADKERKKGGASSKEKDYEKKKSGKEADKERKKQK